MRAALLALLLSRAAAAATAPVAILPSVGGAKEDARRELDGALRGALNDEDTVDLLSPPETRDHVMSLAEMGLVCLPEDVACLVKLGIVANVSLVLVPVAEKGAGDKLEVEIAAIDVTTSQRARAVKAKVAPTDERAVAALIHRALGLPEREPPPPRPPPHPPEPDKPPPDKPPPDKPPPDDPPAGAAKAPPVGVIVTGVAGALAGLALAGALTCDLIYADTLKVADAATRKNLVQPLGATLWATTALAAAGLGAGIYLIATTPEGT